MTIRLKQTEPTVTYIKFIEESVNLIKGINIDIVNKNDARIQKSIDFLIDEIKQNENLEFEFIDFNDASLIQRICPLIGSLPDNCTVPETWYYYCRDDYYTEATLIGLSGKAGSGKDTMADYLSVNHGFKRIAFADKLKEVCAELFNLPLGHFYHRDLKNEKHKNLCGNYLLNKMNHEQLVHVIKDKLINLRVYVKPFIIDNFVKQTFTGDNPIIPKKEANCLTPRQANQLLGTEGFKRQIKQTIWIDYAMQQARTFLQQDINVVIADLRFIDEFHEVKKREGKIVGILRDVAESHLHESEKYIESIIDKADFKIENNSTIEDFENKISKLKFLNIEPKLLFSQ